MMLPKVLLVFTILITLSSLLVSFTFDSASYQTHVWPYILIFLGFTFIRHFFFVLGALLDEQKKRKLETIMRNLKGIEYPNVSILVPAYNEELTIGQTIEHLANLSYPSYEVIVIDDGSSDNTLSVAETTALKFPHISIVVLTQTNGGKASALNLGLYHSSGEIIVGVDADGRIHPDSLQAGVKHFFDAQVGAVAGFVEVENRSSLLEDFQQLEYMISLNYLRKAYSLLGIVPIVPGPIGMFRKAAILSSGGFTDDRHLFAEDAELSLRLIANGWQTRSEEKMIAYTEAPREWKDFFRQRYRWNRGTFQALSRNFSSLMGNGFHLPRFLAIHLFFEVWALPLLNIMLMGNFVFRLIFHGEAYFFTVWIMFSIFIDVWLLVLATFRSRQLLWGLATFVLSKLYYENILVLWRATCLFDEFLDFNMSWDKLDRRGVMKEVENG